MHERLVSRRIDALHQCFLVTFETSIDKFNMHIRTVYVSGRSDLGLRIAPKECIMSAPM